ncbi:peptidoglycan-binding protein [bacterium]|nr:peptidoglycan-binding protein [bacterium]
MGNVNQTSMRTPAARTQQTSPLQPQTTPLDDRAQIADEAVYTQAAPQAKPKEGRGLLGHIGDIFVGGGQAIGDMVKGVANVILHPIQTLKGIGYVITHPATLVHAFVEPYKQAIKDGRPGLALGRGIVEIGSLFVSPSQVVNGAKGVINGAKGMLTGAKGAAQAGAAAGTLGAKGAELSGKIAGQAATAMEKASKLKALGHVGEAAKLEQFGRIMEKAAGFAATGTEQGVARAMKYATWATNAQTVNVATQAGTKVMTMSALAQHSDSLLNAAAKAGSAVVSKADDVGKAAAKAGALAPAYDLPVKLTKNASSAAKTFGLSSQQANTLLGAADDIFKQNRLAGASEKVALEAAKTYMAGQLGVAATDTAVSALANTLKPSTKTLLNNSVTLANQFERTNYITRPLEKGARAIGRPVDKSIVAVNHVAKNVGENLAQVGDKVSNALGKVGDMRLGDIPRAVGQVATYPFKVTYQALAGAGQAIKNSLAGLSNIGDLPLRRIWEAPAEAVGRAVSAGAQLVSNLPDVKLGELAQLARPALAASVIGRVSDVQKTPDDGIAKKYGILDTPANIEAFKAEVASYAEGAIGPETDNPQQVAQLQTILRKIGYDVTPSGNFDEDTALAVIDFKQRAGITQSYKMADGTPAVNEYVDEQTAKALVAVAKRKAGVSETEKTPAPSGEITGRQVKDALVGLDDALGAFDGAKTTAERAKAKVAMEEAALVAIHDLTGYGLAHEDARADVEDKLNEIAAALNERGYSDEELSALIAEGQQEYAAPEEPTKSERPTRPVQGGKAVPAEQPGKTEQAEKPGKTEQAEKPGKAEQGAKPAQPTKPAQTEQTTKPAEEKPAAPTTYVVKTNDNLARIAQQTLGDANRWREIYDLNKQVIGSNPNLILPGQKLQIPGKAAPAPETKPAAGTEPKAETKPATGTEPKAETKPAAGTETKPTVSKEVEALIKERGIQNDPANVQAFLKEVGEYAARGAIGPDSGSPAVVKQLQTLLARLGYDKVQTNGAFDDATGDAIIDFKVKHGLHQTYKLADGTWAVNEYVGEDTAQAMAKAVKDLN